MSKLTDDQVAVPMVKSAQLAFPNLKTCRYDKAFHGKGNQEDLKGLLDTVVPPKKGRLSKDDRAREHDPEFKRLRRQHSAVESAINAPEVHGLDVGRDHGLDGFERYVALAVLSRNSQQQGAIKREQARQRLIEQRKRAA